MLWEAIFVVLCLGASFIGLSLELLPADFAILAVDGLCLTVKIVTVKDALAGFANEGLLSVVILFVVAAGVTETGAIDYLLSRVLGNPRSMAVGQIRLLLPTMVVSAFFNNTPIVAILAPLVVTWCRKVGLSASKFLIPLSYASELGGIVTLIGTSTNLVVSGLAAKKGIHFKLFDLAPMGIPLACAGLIYMALLSDFLLPGDRKKTSDHFLYSAQVPEGSPLVGKTINEAGLRGLPEGLFLASVVRRRRVVAAVDPDFVLSARDVLEFSGLPEHMAQLCKRTGLVLASDDGSADGAAPNAVAPGPGAGLTPVDEFARTGFALVKATVKPGAEVVGQAVKDLGFRRRFGASVVAVRRRGQPLKGNVAQVVLQARDQLLLNTSSEFDVDNWDLKENFLDVADLGGPATSTSAPSLPAPEADGAFMFAMLVQDRSPVVSKTVAQAGLRALQKSYLVAIERATGELINSVGPEEVLAKGDVCWFSGDIASVQNIRKIPGLVPHTNQLSKLPDDHDQRFLVQAVVANHSELQGRTIRDSRFRTRFHAAVLAVHRRGHRLHLKVGDIEVHAGDVLLLEAGPSFMKEHSKSSTFALVSPVEGSAPPRMNKLWVSLILLGAMIALYVANILPLSAAALWAAALMIATKCITVQEARRAIKWDVYIAISAAFGVSTALSNSGAATAIAKALVHVGKAMKLGNLPVQAALYIATAAISQIIANNAAAALMFPIALEAARLNHMNVKVTLNLIMHGASAAFMSPFGYQTNLMVYGAGGYNFMDFVRFGAPLQIVGAVVSLLAAAFIDHWYILAAVSLSAVVVVLGGKLAWEASRDAWRAKHQEHDEAEQQLRELSSTSRRDEAPTGANGAEGRKSWWPWA